jgi:hypothetical protein
MKTAQVARICLQVEKNKIGSIGLQIVMLRSNTEVYVSMYGQQMYVRMIVGLLNKSPGLGTRTSFDDNSGYYLDSEEGSEEVGMFTPRANKEEIGFLFPSSCLGGLSIEKGDNKRRVVLDNNNIIYYIILILGLITLCK